VWSIWRRFAVQHHQRQSGLGLPARAFALVDRSNPEAGCDSAAPPSSIVSLSLAAPSELGFDFDYGSPIADLAVSVDGQTLVVADPCTNGGEVRAVDPQSGDVRTVLSLPTATAVAVLGDRVWAVGSLAPAEGKGRRLALASAQLDGSNATMLELAAAEEIVETSDFTEPGQTPAIRMQADDLAALDLAIAPGGGHIAVLARAYFHADEQIDPFFGLALLPQVDQTTYEYLLLDASAGTPVHRVRTSCDLVTSDAIVANWSCSETPGQDIATSPFIPTGVAVLHGSQ
jgi:hypothetical protein